MALGTHGDTLEYSLPPQRINILQQLLQQEVEGLAMGNCAPLNGGSAFDMTELKPPMAEISRTLTASEHNSGAALVGLSQHSGGTEPLLSEECEEPQACPEEETKAAQPCSTTELKSPVPHRAEPELPEPCLPALPGPPLPSCRGQAEPPMACPRTEPGASAACALEAGTPESSPQPCCNQRPPATTSLTFSSQSPVCASPPIHSLYPLRCPTGYSGKELAGKGREEKAVSLGVGPVLHQVRALSCLSKWLRSLGRGSGRGGVGQHPEEI